MREKRRINYFLIIFIVAVILRILLAFVNREANDNHFEIIQIMLNENKIPILTDCWECYQPKFYHFFCANIFKFFSIDFINSQIITAQLINTFAGILTIYIIFIFLNKMKINEKIRLIGFSLIALNPKLIGINAQVTNDSFVILFSTLTIYFFYIFLIDIKKKFFILMLIFTIFAVISKGTSLVLYPIICLILLIKLFQNWKTSKIRNAFLVFFIIFNLFFLLTAPYFGQYLSKYYRYGSPFTINVKPSPFPNIFKETLLPNVVPTRPGVTSIVHSYFTFRFVDLIQHPYILHPDYTPKRTSLWTQIYARANSVHFDLWPPSWRPRYYFILQIVRIIFILALIPALLLIYGFFINIKRILKLLFYKKSDIFYQKNDWIFVLFFIGFIFFIIKATLAYRDFCTMKAIYIYPGLICFIKIFIDGTNKFYLSLLNYSIIEKFFNIIFISLISFYFLEILTLIIQLY